MDLTSLSIPAAVKRTFSPYQEAIFSHLNSPNNLIVQAVAGSGKTFTMIEMANRLNCKACFLAFNKSIADELRSKVTGAEVKTLNALGHAIVTRRLPGVKLESWKTANAVRSKLNTEEYAEFGPQVSRLVSLAKGSAFGIINDASRQYFLELVDQFEIDIPADKIAKATATATTIFQQVINDFTSFDFDDQLFMPVFHCWTFPTFDVVFIDEAQDLNPIQHLILSRLQTNGARIIAVGDSRQAIYGFRGAMQSSMEILKDRFAMLELPLSITYRCDRRIVELAQSLVPHIEARPGAAPGEVLYTDSIDITKVPDNCLVVCRNNAPIFGLAMKALVARRPVRVLSNFTEQLKSFIKGFKTRDLKILEERLLKWYEFEMQQAEEAGFYGRMQYLTDKYESVRFLIAESTTIDDVMNALERFGNSTTGPTLCTIHKAKGLEAERTIILNREKLPSRFAHTEASLQQENNLLYVAITRAKHELTIHTAEM